MKFPVHALLKEGLQRTATLGVSLTTAVWSSHNSVNADCCCCCFVLGACTAEHLILDFFCIQDRRTEHLTQRRWRGLAGLSSCWDQFCWLRVSWFLQRKVSQQVVDSFKIHQCIPHRLFFFLPVVLLADWVVLLIH